MAAKINEVIRARYDLLTKTVDALEKKIKSFPDGSIKVKKTDYGVYYCLKLANKTDRHLTTEFYTLNGEHVRSKSEVIIADRLYAKGIPYKYECPLQIGNRIIHPDFTILRLSDRKIIYHEHCGMMDDPNYAKDMVNRINLYSTADIYLGDRLFFTLETSETPLDIRHLDELIEKHFR